MHEVVGWDDCLLAAVLLCCNSRGKDALTRCTVQMVCCRKGFYFTLYVYTEGLKCLYTLNSAPTSLGCDVWLDYGWIGAKD